jgi:hypothetical protein
MIGRRDQHPRSGIAAENRQQRQQEARRRAPVERLHDDVLGRPVGELALPVPAMRLGDDHDDAPARQQARHPVEGRPQQRPPIDQRAELLGHDAPVGAAGEGPEAGPFSRRQHQSPDLAPVVHLRSPLRCPPPGLVSGGEGWMRRDRPGFAAPTRRRRDRA